jgi:hypothetical protein
MDLDLVPTGHTLDHFCQQLLRELHHIRVVTVVHVQLTARELWVVGGVHALVPEVLADLKHALQAAHQELLQVQLWGDAHVQVHVQLV